MLGCKNKVETEKYFLIEYHSDWRRNKVTELKVLSKLEEWKENKLKTNGKDK